ncbi:hypothetical protein TVAG_228070 [Trichomonas vaginalis G3]|uniref:Uncharacterized protein n=1 Tax=Trichomonas vaginalis (strain ATCC PRA-98 / G3) TaxID=412133 RepID=A2FW15_TRIV3|nr:spectrin binding [Trichomonas vaginalis G3]EAX90906.1 hypothetical protein TVAG_228070 [Trichomonas vaginalis G3]KAI5509147.1 spectrin binding [Trichomonas vaginalis G3]|eukprot:XP_001303836.1 hypothetical protein [Trichomonas vaginalis G3]
MANEKAKGKFEFLRQKFAKYIEVETMIRDIRTENDVDKIMQYIETNNVDIQFVIGRIKHCEQTHNYGIVEIFDLVVKLYEKYKFPIYADTLKDRILNLFYYKYKFPFMETYYYKDDPEFPYDDFQHLYYGYPKDSWQLAIAFDDIDKFKTFKDIDLNSEDLPIYTRSPISLAAIYGSEKCFDYLLQKGEEIDEDTLFAAIKGRNRHIIQKHLEQNITLNAHHFEALINCGDFDLFMELLTKIKEKDRQVSKFFIFGTNVIIFFYCYAYGYCVDDLLFDLPDFRSAEIMKYFIYEEKININITTKWNLSLLYFTIINDNFDAIKLVVERGAKLTGLKDGENALFYAARTDSEEIVDYFIKEKGLNPKQFAENNESPLHVAVDNSCMRTTMQLIEKYNVPVDICDSSGLTPIFYVSEIKVAEYLIQKGAKINKMADDQYLVDYLCSSEKPFAVIKYIVEKGGKYSPNILSYAITTENTDYIDYFAKRIKPRDRDPQDLFDAIDTEKPEVVECLLKNGYDANVKHPTLILPLFHAIKEGSPDEIIEVLLKYKANPNVFKPANVSIVNLAIRCESENFLKILLKYGADYTVREKENGSSLDYCMYQKQSMLPCFLEFAPNLDPFINTKSGPLFYYLCMKNNHKAVSALLRGKKFDINKCIYGDNALQLAVATDSLETVQILINNGADTNLKNQENMNILALSILDSKNRRVFKWLIQNLPNAEELAKERSSDGLTIFERCLQNGNLDSANILFEKGWFAPDVIGNLDDSLIPKIMYPLLKILK